VQDTKNLQATYKASVAFKPLACASIFDAKTQESLVYLDLPIQIASQSVIFYYGFTNCPGFTFNKVKVTFDISVPGVTLSSGDHN